jgi:hypothetical protein
MKFLLTPYFNFTKVADAFFRLDSRETPINIKVDEDLVNYQSGLSLEQRLINKFEDML